jgi:hypothetical protein
MENCTSALSTWMGGRIKCQGAYTNIVMMQVYCTYFVVPESRFGSGYYVDDPHGTFRPARHCTVLKGRWRSQIVPSSKGERHSATIGS